MRMKMFESLLQKEKLKEYSEGEQEKTVPTAPVVVVSAQASDDNQNESINSLLHTRPAQTENEPSIEKKVVLEEQESLPALVSHVVKEEAVIVPEIIAHEEQIENVEIVGEYAVEVCDMKSMASEHLENEAEYEEEYDEDVEGEEERDEMEVEYSEEYLDPPGDAVAELQYTVESNSGDEQMVLVQKIKTNSTGNKMPDSSQSGEIICCGCNQRFESKVELNQHSLDVHLAMRLKKSPKEFECNVCYKRFANAKRLNFHQLSVYKVKDHGCDKCSARFTFRGSLLSHLKTHADRTYVCEICLKSFFTSSTLQSHRLLHTHDKKFKCTEPNCTKSFLRKADMHIHLVSHSDERPYVCEICSSRFKSKAHLVHHGKVHTKAKPYKCDRCERAFGTYSARKFHQLSHDGIHPYKCKYCEKIYQRNTKLQVHIRRMHTGERPFACDICENVRFYQNWELTAHKKNVHQGQSGASEVHSSSEKRQLSIKVDTKQRKTKS
ncbi:zinc finger protein 436-like isoform X2 [Uranotaenia lowii]|uniref:zinc finger protein 436-like isoform X2 n=1 Tax=Uranotaenia lowii TaxID=190385 RepID=UPI00247AD5CD|nr:zinc finger protein 436-like isoform X2 [Uranotaenia lowii]